MSCLIHTGEVLEDSSATLLARIERSAEPGTGAVVAVPDDFSALTYKVFSDSVQIFSGSLVIADCVLDEITLDDTWEEDSIGYNCVIPAPSTWFPTGSTKTRVEIKIVFVGGAIAHAVWEIAVENLLGS